MKTGRLRPYIISTVFVAAWVFCGWLLQLDPASYSLIGMPFVVAFQLLVCRRPVYQLWAREAKGFGLGRRGWLFAIGIIASNAFLFWPLLKPWRPWGALFLTLLIIGSVGAGFALRQQRMDRLAPALPGFVVAILIGCLLAWTLQRPLPLHPSLPLVLLKHFVRLLPMTFICDEVVFRGLLDSYVAPSVGSRSQAWISAVFVSALWGFWHMWHAPVFLDFIFTVALGVALSFCWRKSGTLLLPGAAHALIDAVRDTILSGH